MKLLYTKIIHYQDKIYEVKEYINDKGHLIGEWVILGGKYKRKTNSQRL